ncbi:MAG TPA: neutral zinc metallopeptidase [Vicinamibacterales bacterium]|nr:neutral zinc metallopeptidase [Vicinamibacterales bacterium]
MRWTPGSGRNIDDERGRRTLGVGAVPLGLGGVVLLAVLSLATGVNFFSLLDGGSPPSSAAVDSGSRPATSSPAEDREVRFVDAVAEDVQDTWAQLIGTRYERTKVVLFRDAIDSACGFAQSATGPFYCPEDQRVYLDLGFFDELRQRFSAPGEFAEAYVLAHEFGHHVQSLTGLERQVRAAEQRNPSQANEISVRVELQADCYAGVWGHAASQPGRNAQGKVELEPGDMEDALRAAAAIGDDRLQRMATGRVMPDRFTHGTSEQRVDWFRRGFQSGDPSVCNAFHE